MATLMMRFICTILVLCLLSMQAYGHGGASDDHDDDASSPPANLHDKGLILVKIYCLVIFLVSTFVSGISPYFFKWNESFLLMGTQFAGGVFLGTSLMHFLSDSNSTFEARTSVEYPFAFMLASAGYLLTMLSDCIIGTLTKSKVQVDEGEGLRSSGANTDAHDGHVAFARTTSLGDTILLIFALCFHSVFEGIAVGVARTKGDAWRSTWTIVLHKLFAAVAMGIALLKMLPSRPFLTSAAYSFAFAVSSPVGVGIGIAIDATAEGAVADWIYAISMGIACGVFVYVAINHLIAKGFKPSKPSMFDTPYYKFLAVLFGIGVIAVVMAWD